MVPSYIEPAHWLWDPSLVGQRRQPTPCDMCSPWSSPCVACGPNPRASTCCMWHRVLDLLCALYVVQGATMGHMPHLAPNQAGPAHWLQCSPIQTRPRASAQNQSGVGATCRLPPCVACSMFNARSSPHVAHGAWAGVGASMCPMRCAGMVQRFTSQNIHLHGLNLVHEPYV